MRRVLVNRWPGWLAVLVTCIGAWQVLILWKFPKGLRGLVPVVRSLVAVLLGVGFARLLTLPDLSALARRIVLAALIVLLLVPMAVLWHPLLVVGRGGERRSTPGPRCGRRALPPGGEAGRQDLPAVGRLDHYLAGIRPYLRQIHSTKTRPSSRTTSPSREERPAGRKEMEEWLGRNARTTWCWSRERSTSTGSGIRIT